MSEKAEPVSQFREIHYDSCSGFWTGNDDVIVKLLD